MNKEKHKLLKIVDDFSKKKVAVWGDLILDEYVYGNTRRISREAPVLILSFRRKEFSLGGAGNSLLNLKALGATPIPVGVIGNDMAGRKITQILKRHSIPADFIIKDKHFSTPQKTRILAGEETAKKQQILRIDRESRVSDSPATKQNIKKMLQGVQQKTSALLISDYNYYTVKEDLLEENLPMFHKEKIPVTLDSRFRILNFNGVTILTPNEPEAEEALKIEINDDNTVIQKAGKLLLNKTQSKAVLITRGSKGMILFEKGKKPYYIPIHGTTDIVDVTGAGDTVISTLTLALTCGATFREAAHLANYAGSIVVMKKGTATLTQQELKSTIIS